MKPPKVIFLDAAGTIFGIKGSVGEIYSQVAQEFGVTVSPQDIDKAFYHSFKAAPPPIFPDAEEEDIPQREFEWWFRVASNTFERTESLELFPDFTDFFSELYIHFGTADPWFVYPDVLPCLEKWRNMGIQLGILSNFDSRIYSVLQALGLREFFSTITICTQVGYAKPDTKIFTAALEKHNCLPQDAWHIGDSVKEDYHGAKAAGLRGIWINRGVGSGE
jgi:putative hydrolase of the HAD superfamily